MAAPPRNDGGVGSPLAEAKAVRQDAGMVAIDEIRNENSIRAWLEETNQPQAVCIALAYRAAMRVLPIAWDHSTGNDQFHVMPLLRALLVSGVAGGAPADLLTEAGHALALRLAARAAAEDAGAAGVDVGDASGAAARAAARAAAWDTPRAAAWAAGAAAGAAGADAGTATWSALRSDCEALERGQPLTSLPLFDGAPPAWFEEHVGHLKLGADWAFWLEWYAKALEGRPQNWPLLLEIAIQADNFWQGSDADINALIAEIVATHKSDEVPEDSLDTAIANSPNAERVEKTSDGLYDLVPDSEVLPEPFAKAVQRIHNALADIAKVLSNQSTQQYYALREIADLVGTELDRSLDAPMLIYEALMQAILDLDHLSKVGELPPNDRRIERFRTQFHNSALDILLNDQKVREAVTARAAFKVFQLSPEEANQVRVLADALARCSTSRLGNLLRKGGTTATSEKVSEEVRRIAIYEYGSRTIRMYGVDNETFNNAANTASIFGFIATVISWLQ